MHELRTEMRRMVTFGIAWAVVGTWTAAIAEEPAPAISLKSLLLEMVDRETLARWPQPTYTCRQASSYDRQSRQRGSEDWFANHDWSQFIRKETTAGRTEWVMMDAEGPGSIVRMWMGNPHPERPNLGVLRMYLDGSATLVVEMPAEKFLNGGLVGPPLSAVRCIGRNLYLPLPYARHCKVTYDRNYWTDGKRDPDRAWYVINYRTYPPGTPVETFSRERLTAAKASLDQVQNMLLKPEDAAPKGMRTVPGIQNRLEPGGKLVRTLSEGPMAVCRLSVRVTADDLEQALRSTVLDIRFDDERAVWCPVGDFFGSGVGLNPYRGWYQTVAKDGWMTCYWIMPFRRSAQIQLHNLGRRPVDAALGDIGVCPWKWDDRSMIFHAGWRQQAGIPTRPYSDFNYVEVRGRGVYVGDMLAIHNGTQGWWGEGDEKIFVDDEASPSHFGTGSEDYYGYSFGDVGVFFEAPFHAEPRWHGNVGPGHTTNVRTRSLDAIPFTTSLDVNLEVWHWKDTQMTYAAATYWYAIPGATSNRSPQPEEVGRPIEDIAVITGVRTVPGAIEGETMRIVKRSGGVTEVQLDDRWSGGRQLWWRDGSIGDRLDLALPVAQAGPYRIVMHNTRAFDYGTFQFHLDGRKLGETIDLYSAENIVKLVAIGSCRLDKGEHVLTAEIVGTNPKAKKRYMLGLDYVKLEPAP
jgi:hypothetical protein